MLFKLSKLNSNLALTLGYLNPALNNSAQVNTAVEYRPIVAPLWECRLSGWGGGGTLGISEWGYAAGTLDPLTYTRVSSAEFCYPILQ